MSQKLIKGLSQDVGARKRRGGQERPIEHSRGNRPTIAPAGTPSSPGSTTSHYRKSEFANHTSA